MDELIFFDYTSTTAEGTLTALDAVFPLDKDYVVTYQDGDIYHVWKARSELSGTDRVLKLNDAVVFPPSSSKPSSYSDLKLVNFTELLYCAYPLLVSTKTLLHTNGAVVANFRDYELFNGLITGLNRFNSVPVLSNFTFQNLPNKFYPLIQDSALIDFILMRSVGESSKSYSYSDNGLGLTRSIGAAYMSNLTSPLLVSFYQRLRDTKLSLRYLIKGKGLKSPPLYNFIRRGADGFGFPIAAFGF